MSVTRTFRVDIGAGENVTCTFANTKDASLIVRKTTVGGVGAFDFDGTGTNVPSDIDITTIAAGTPVAASTIDFVAAPVNQFGVKLVTENVTAGWALTGLSCSGDTTDLEIGYISGGSFTLGSGGAGFDVGDTTFRIDIGAGERHLHVHQHQGRLAHRPQDDGRRGRRLRLRRHGHERPVRHRHHHHRGRHPGRGIDDRLRRRAGQPVRRQAGRPRT